MNEKLVKHLEKTKECNHSYWKDHYQKATDDEKLDRMEGKVAQLKRQIDKASSMIGMVLFGQLFCLAYFIWQLVFNDIDLPDTFWILAYFFLLIATYSAWMDCDEYGDNWDEPFDRDSKGWRKWFNARHR